MKLSEIIKDIDITATFGPAPDEVEITSITADSRKVTDACLFIAVKGCSADGHAFIQQAFARGAAAVLYENGTPEVDAPEGVAVVRAVSSRKALGRAASAFYGHPSSQLKLIGITGTNGKTTTVTLLHHLFTAMGYKCGLLSTIANYVSDKEYEAVNTTSDPITINSLMRQMLDEGCTHCFMEVSSIGMEQDRVEGLDFKLGIFSNLTHDHLDYHHTFDEYLRCKKLFFDSLGRKAVAITNVDDKNGMVMMQNTKARVVTYSLTRTADHTARIMEQSFEGMMLNIDGTECWTPLIGKHNAYNLLAIYSAAVALGAEKIDVLTALSALTSAKGRLETINLPGGACVVIDYAHTPDALENVLKTLKGIAPKRPLVCCFGCGGDRDATKRPEMARVAEKYADRIVVTSDNSRSEKTSDIIAGIRAGFSREGLRKTVEIEDRAQAIRTAIMLAGDNSTILLAGKGHETYQIIGKEKHHFDEREIVLEYIGGKQ